tara:strand:+ start:5911 stop:6153 length:243 start_codon:yes stop_codon:yes gene_type:complete
MEGYRLTTAEILYRMPDHPAILQTFIWQEYDLQPKLPNLNKFLKFWEHEIEGPIHSILVAKRQLITADELNMRNYEVTWH